MALSFTSNEVPLQPQAQQLYVSLNGVTYQLTLRWNAYSAAWVADLASASGTPMISGFPLVTGVDLLEQFEYLGIGGALVVQSDNDPNLVPNYGSLGVTGHLYYLLGST